MADTIASLVDEHTFTYDDSTTVGEAIDDIRTSRSEETTVYYAYVTDASGRLQGVVSMRELLNAGDTDTLGAITTGHVVRVSTDEGVDEAAKTITSTGYPVIPAVDGTGAFQGVVRAEDVIAALDEEATKDVLRYNLRDVAYDPDDRSPYECFECGTLIEAIDNPGPCPNCGGEMRHQLTPIE